MDLALTFDPNRMLCDLVLSGGDLALDATPAPALLLSLGTDARAKADDPLPALPVTPTGSGARPAERRGWWGDCLDPDTQTIGCRLWLLAREKTTESVRRGAEAYAAEGLAWAVAQGRAVTVAAGYDGTRLVLRARLGAAALSLPVGRR